EIDIPQIIVNPECQRLIGSSQSLFERFSRAPKLTSICQRSGQIIVGCRLIGRINLCGVISAYCQAILSLLVEPVAGVIPFSRVCPGPVKYGQSTRHQQNSRQRNPAFHGCTCLPFIVNSRLSRASTTTAIRTKIPKRSTPRASVRLSSRPVSACAIRRARLLISGPPVLAR